MKLLRSIVRTILAIGLIVISVGLLYHTINWQSWIPNNDFGAGVWMYFWFSSMLGIACGIFGISPVFWTAFLGAYMVEYQGVSMKKVRLEVVKLRKKYIW